MGVNSKAGDRLNLKGRFTSSKYAWCTDEDGESVKKQLSNGPWIARLAAARLAESESKAKTSAQKRIRDLLARTQSDTATINDWLDIGEYVPVSILARFIILKRTICITSHCSYANLSQAYKREDCLTAADRKKRRVNGFAVQMPAMLEAYDFYQRQHHVNGGQSSIPATRTYFDTVRFDVDEDEETYGIMAIGVDCKFVHWCSLLIANDAIDFCYV